jgi:hypothetical protein
MMQSYDCNTLDAGSDDVVDVASSDLVTRSPLTSIGGTGERRVRAAEVLEGAVDDGDEGEPKVRPE